MKRVHQSAPAVPLANLANTVPNTPAPAVDWLTALRLALLRTIAVTVALAAVASVAALAFAWQETGERWPLVVAAVLATVGATFVLSLWRYTDEVRRRTWAAEIALGMDLTGDGLLGDPRQRVRLVPVTANGQRQEPVTWTEDEPTDQPAPILDGFELDVVDVAAFITEAGQRGLAKSAWLRPGERRFLLPSGEPVTRGVWDRATKELVRIGWAESPPTGLVLTGSTNDLLVRLYDVLPPTGHR